MRKSIVSLLAAVLAALMLCGCLVSCGETEEGSKTQTTTAAAENSAAASTTAAEVQTTEDPAYVCDLPDTLNYGDRTINMLVDNYSYSSDEFYAETENGSVINDTVYARNLRVESKLGVKLAISRAATNSDTEVAKAVQNAVSAGDKTYDICTIPGYRATQYIKGNFTNLVGIENLDLDKGYWTQGFNSIMRVGNKQYLASGSYSLSMIRGMYVTLYNNALIDEWKLEDPIKMVNNDTWTFENQTLMLKDVYRDLNGDNNRDYEDLYGFGGTCYSTSDAYWVSWNLPFLSIDANNEYAIDIDTDKFSKIVSLYHDFMFNNEGIYCICTGSKDDRGVNAQPATIEMFANRHAVMVTIDVSRIESTIAGQMADEYSICPLPKLDASQENYYSHVSDRLTCMAIVSTVSAEDLPMMGAVMEAISSDSYNSVFPTYYEQILGSRYLQNFESKRMLDLMFNGIRIEGAFLYASYFGILTTTRTLFATGEGVASTLTSSTTKWKASLKQLNKLISNLE